MLVLPVRTCLCLDPTYLCAGIVPLSCLPWTWVCNVLALVLSVAIRLPLFPASLILQMSVVNCLSRQLSPMLLVMDRGL